jgi:FtsP/CotA-like multicopper oxidase with cupredoxin domain
MRLTASIASRRRVLAGAGAAVTWLSLPLGAKALRAEAAGELAPDGFRLLYARAGSAQGPDRARDGGETPIWGFQGAMPGPLLRVKCGEELIECVGIGRPETVTAGWFEVA